MKMTKKDLAYEITFQITMYAVQVIGGILLFAVMTRSVMLHWFFSMIGGS